MKRDLEEFKRIEEEEKRKTKDKLDAERMIQEDLIARKEAEEAERKRKKLEEKAARDKAESDRLSALEMMNKEMSIIESYREDEPSFEQPPPK